jgi:hypothetical protein
LATEHKVGQIFANSIYEPIWLDKDKKLAHKLSKQDISLEVSPGMLLYDPFAIKTAQGNPFQVFTPYWRACLQRDSAPGNPIAAPAKIPALSHPPAGANLKDLNLLPKIKWDGGIVETWTPGLDGAKTALDLFIDNALRNYAETRNLPYEVGTSRLSPYLHFGEISPRRVWQEVSEHLHTGAQAILCLFINVLARVALFLAFGWPVVLANVIATSIVFWSTQFVNTFCHMENFGYRTFNTREDSRNVWWVGILACGEGWHNNHHAMPKSAQHGMANHEFDITWYTIWVLEKLGLAKAVVRPNPVVANAKRLSPVPQNIELYSTKARADMPTVLEDYNETMLIGASSSH